MNIRVLPLPRIPQELSIVVSGKGDLVASHVSFPHGKRHTAARISNVAMAGKRTFAVGQPVANEKGAGDPLQSDRVGALDFGTAAAWLGLAAASPGMRLIIHGVTLDPDRLAFADLLVRMGARLREEVVECDASGCSGILDIRGGALHGISVPPEWTSRIAAEVPILVVIAATACGNTTISGLDTSYSGMSESLVTVCVNLRLMGCIVEREGDGLKIYGTGRIFGTRLHMGRSGVLARAFMIAALLAEGTSELCETSDFQGPSSNFFPEILLNQFQLIR